MSYDTYAELLSAVATYADRDDLTAVFPIFVRNVESTLNKRLSDPEQEIVVEVVAAGDYTALPTDFGEMVSITTGEGPVRVMGPADYAGLDEAWTGIPIFYTIADNSIAFYPRNSTANIRMLYRRSIPPLTATDTTNWLLSRAPEVYFRGVMFEETTWERDMEAAAGWKALFEESIADLMNDGTRRKWGAGPIAPRIMRT